MSRVQVYEPQLVGIAPLLLGADSAINWLIVCVDDEQGTVGYGEATLEGKNHEVAALITVLAEDLCGRDVGSAIALTNRATSSLPEATALSAVNQALWDLRARHADTSLAHLLGGRDVTVPPLYANINRAIVGDRSPSAFVRVARAAEQDGYQAIKIAPFDGVVPGQMSRAELRHAIDNGLARTSAVVDAVNIEVRLDLHWRFDVDSAIEVIAELEAFPLGWIEGPLREHDLDGWRTVRDSTTSTLAGGETLTSAHALDTFLAASKVDIAMPDIKYCGGVDGFRKCLEVTRRHGAVASPHNPSGPVATLATVHAASGDSLHSLEVAWRPSRSPLDVIHGSALDLPAGAGLGFTLDAAAASQFPAHDEPDSAPTDLI